MKYDKISRPDKAKIVRLAFQASVPERKAIDNFCRKHQLTRSEMIRTAIARMIHE